MGNYLFKPPKLIYVNLCQSIFLNHGIKCQDYYFFLKNIIENNDNIVFKIGGSNFIGMERSFAELFDLFYANKDKITIIIGEKLCNEQILLCYACKEVIFDNTYTCVLDNFFEINDCMEKYNLNLPKTKCVFELNKYLTNMRKISDNEKYIFVNNTMKFYE